MTTYNQLLNKLYSYDYLIGFKNGKGKVLKWRENGDWIDKDESNLHFIINQLIQVLLTKTGIKLFDEAIKMELSEAVYNIIEKHKIVEDENNDRKKRAS